MNLQVKVKFTPEAYFHVISMLFHFNDTLTQLAK